MKLRQLNWRKFSGLSFSSWNVASVISRPAVIVLVITVFMYAVVGIFYKTISLKMIRTKVSRTVETTAPVAGVIKKEPVDAFKVIVDRNLFGSTDKTIADKQTDQGKSEMDIATMFELKGTIAGDRNYGFAIIEEKGKGKQRLYKVGDSVAAARLTQIRRSSVVLRVGDQDKILKMAEARESPILPPRAPGSAAAASDASGPIAISKSEVGATMKDMGAMLSQAQIRPYFAAGVPEGFMISNIRQGSIYQKMRLADGDIIQGINNKQVKTADDMVEFYNMLKSGSNINLKIKRQGKQESLNYVFQ
jgi:type II secretion system protein C